MRVLYVLVLQSVQKSGSGTAPSSQVVAEPRAQQRITYVQHPLSTSREASTVRRFECALYARSEGSSQDVWVLRYYPVN